MCNKLFIVWFVRVYRRLPLAKASDLSSTRTKHKISLIVIHILSQYKVGISQWPVIGLVLDVIKVVHRLTQHPFTESCLFQI